MAKANFVNIYKNSPKMQSFCKIYTKTLLTTDWYEQDIQGIKVANVMKWLTNDK